MRRIDDVTARELWAAIRAEQVAETPGARLEAIAARLDAPARAVDRDELTIRLAVLVARGLLVCPEPPALVWAPTPAGTRHGRELTGASLADSAAWAALATERPSWIGTGRPEVLRVPVPLLAVRVGASVVRTESWCGVQARGRRMAREDNGGWTLTPAGVDALVAAAGVPA